MRLVVSPRALAGLADPGCTAPDPSLDLPTFPVHLLSERETPAMACPLLRRLVQQFSQPSVTASRLPAPCSPDGGH